MRYPDHLKEEIRSRIDIVETISRYVALKKSGASFKGLCPFHQEKTPSFTVTPSRNIFHCFGCGKGGDIFSFLMEIEHLGFSEAVEVLAKEAGIDLSRYATSKGTSREDSNPLLHANQFACAFFHESLKKDKAAQAYFQKRGLADETLRLFKLGYAPEGWDHLLRAAARAGFAQADLERAGLVIVNPDTGQKYDRFRGRIMFPICNLSGLAVGFGARSLEADPKQAKYINSPETPVYKKSALLYGLHLARPAIHEKGEALVVEGYMDFHALFQAGIRHAVASSGTAFTQEQAGLLRRYTENVCVVFDGDAAGQAASERGVQVMIAAGLQVKVVTLPAETDPDLFVREKGPEAFLKLISGAEGFLDYKFRMARKKNPSDTPEDKARVIAEMAGGIALIPGETVREEYIRLMESRLQLQSGQMRRQVAKAFRKGSVVFSKKNEPETASNSSFVLEKEILSFLVVHPELASEAKVLEEVPDIWSHDGLRSFFRRVLAYIREQEVKEGEAIHFETGLHGFSAKQGQFILQVLAEGREKYLPEGWSRCMSRFLRRYFNQKKAALRIRLKENPAGRNDLMKEYENLLGLEKAMITGAGFDKKIEKNMKPD